MVDLTRDEKGRYGRGCSTWCRAAPARYRMARGARRDVPAGIDVATLDPFHGYKNAIDDQLEDAVAVLDAFHVVKLGTDAVDECRRRVQQEIHGHRGRKGDPLYGIRDDPALRPGERSPTGSRARLDRAIVADERHDEVDRRLAVRPAAPSSAYPAKHAGRGQAIAEKILASFRTCPIPEIARLGRDPQAVEKTAFLAYFDTGRANNGGTEAINGLIELHRRIARGFRNRDNYRLRMLLIGGGLSHPHLK